MNFDINSIYGDIIEVSVDETSTGSMSRVQSAVFITDLLEAAEQIAYHLGNNEGSRKIGDLIKELGGD